MIGLVDGNNFFVSCERIFEPWLNGKPVAVLSNNDGCVVSRSNEFKALKIPMGTPFFKLCPHIKRLGLILRSSNYKLYGDISQRIMQILSDFSPEVEQYSIDEAFVYAERKSFEEYESLAKTMRETILQWVGVPCGVGFAPTKTLAKIANHTAKKKPSGIFIMPDDPQPLLKTVPVGEVWGIGRRLAPKLANFGITTAARLADTPEEFLQKQFNINVVKTARELRGLPQYLEEEPEKPSQSITRSRSFGQPVTDLAELKQSLAYYAAGAAQKLREENQTAAGCHIYMQYYPEYNPPQEGGWSGTSIVFPEPADYTADIQKYILEKVEDLFIKGRRYKKTGVTLFGLEPRSHKQPDLFYDNELDEKKQNLSKTLDAINRQFGRSAIHPLSEGLTKPWMMKRDHLSRDYTGSWDDLLIVR